jgi:DegV family protein with EDD domain
MPDSKECFSSMKIRLSTDSSSDLPLSILQRYNIHVEPITVVCGEQSLRDGVDITSASLFEYVESGKGTCHTAAINVDQYQRMFQKLLADADAVLHISISSGLSSCYQNACIAASEFENVYVVDSLNLSSGIGHLVMDAAEMIEKELPIEQIVETINETAKKVESSFVINTLKYMQRGGRCSSVEALGANLLQLRPCIEVVDGNMTVCKKYRGKYEHVMEKYVTDRLKDRTDIDYSRVFITSSDCSEELIELVRQTIVKYAPFETILVSWASSTISCHCGPNTLGILFKRK